MSHCFLGQIKGKPDTGPELRNRQKGQVLAAALGKAPQFVLLLRTCSIWCSDLMAVNNKRSAASLQEQWFCTLA